jgi:hypothetical protein
MSRCEDYPCCGHTDLDPCDGNVISEPWYCDDCGGYHFSLYCPDGQWDEDDEPEYEEDPDEWADDAYWAEDAWLDGSYEE